jgi:probable rRNA maturation factor
MAAALRYGQHEGQGTTRPGDGPGQHFSRALCLRNRHATRGVRLKRLRPIVQALLHETWPDAGFDLAIYLVAAPEMTRLNEAYLHHAGSTDVITFDYTERAGQGAGQSRPSPTTTSVSDRQGARTTLLHGEIFICLDEAVRQARRFHTTWQSELVRYIVHGVLHLLGYDDHKPQVRRRMKTAEDALVRRLADQFTFSNLLQT